MCLAHALESKNWLNMFDSSSWSCMLGWEHIQGIQFTKVMASQPAPPNVPPPEIIPY